MTHPEIRTFIEEHVIYKDWRFHVAEDTHGALYVQVHFLSRCPITGRDNVQQGRKWLLSTHMTPTEIVGTCYAAVRRAELHEVEEAFLFKGVRVFNPHRDIEALVEIAGREDRRR